MEKLTMEQISNYCKHYGFIYPGSEIYDGFANTWDFGPLGRMLNNIKYVGEKDLFNKEKAHMK